MTLADAKKRIMDGLVLVNLDQTNAGRDPAYGRGAEAALHVLEADPDFALRERIERLAADFESNWGWMRVQIDGGIKEIRAPDAEMDARRIAYLIRECLNPPKGEGTS